MSPRSRRVQLARDIAVGLTWALLIATGIAAATLGMPTVRPMMVGNPLFILVVNGTGLALTTFLLAPRTRSDTPTTPDVLSAPTLVFLSGMWAAPLLAATALFWWRPGRTRLALLRGAVAGVSALICGAFALGVEMALRPLGLVGDEPLARQPLAVLVLFVLGLVIAGAYRGIQRLLLRRADEEPPVWQKGLATVSIFASALLVPLSVEIAATSPALVVLGTVAVVSLTYAFAVYRASVQEAADGQQRLLRATIAAGDAERARIAGRIHDGPVQVLVATLMLTEPDGSDGSAGAARMGALTLDEVRGLLRRAEVELRAISAAAGPGPVVKDLRASLATSVAALPLEGVRLSWSIPDRVDPELARAAWPILAEAIRNAVAHGEATHVQITVAVSPGGGLRAWVHDDGVGFDVRGGSPTGHLGLALMKERALAAGGRLALMSEPGEGTVVHLHVPDVDARGPVRETPVWICVHCLDEWRGQFLARSPRGLPAGAGAVAAAAAAPVVGVGLRTWIPRLRRRLHLGPVGATTAAGVGVAPGRTARTARAAGTARGVAQADAPTHTARHAADNGGRVGTPVGATTARKQA